jgi:hypothetical protein
MFEQLSEQLMAQGGGWGPSSLWEGLSMAFGVGLPRGSLAGFILAVINAAVMLAGIVALGAIVYGGFRYITAGGDERNIQQAKLIVTYAVVGLLVIILAAVIVNFVIFAGAGAGG